MRQLQSPRRKMRVRERMFASVRTRLSVLVLLALVPTITLISLTAAEQRRLTLVSVEEHALQLLRFASVSQQQLIEGTRHLLMAVAQLPEVRSGNAAACRALFRNMLKQHTPYVVFGVAKLDGDIVCSVPGAPDGTANIAGRTFFRKALQDNDFAVGEYQVERVTGKATLNFGYPVRDDSGRVRAMLYATLDITSLNALAAEVKLPPGSVFTILDRNGTVLASHPNMGEWLGKPVPDQVVASAVLAGQDEGTVFTSGVEPRMHAFSRLRSVSGSNDLWVSVSIPASELFRDADRMFARNLIGLVFVCAAALCTVWVGSEILFNRVLKVLLNATEQLAKGNLTVRTGLNDTGEFGQLARAFDRMAEANAKLFSDLQHSHTELARAYEETLEGLVRALDLRDHETEGHSRRVTEMTIHVARKLGIGGRDLVHLRRGALLHDIGKIGIPDSILMKPGALTEEEWAIMRQHPVYGYELLSEISYLRKALDIPYYHHERWDGGGYPQGVREEKIPLAARAFAVVDVYDALSSERPYRPAWPRDKVIEYIREQSGKHFDPAAVAAFLRILKDGGDE